MQPDDNARLIHMREAALSAASFVEGRSRADLDKDIQLQFALTRAIEIIGEAASKITPGTKARFPGIEWARIIGIRNRLVHAYFTIDHDILWNTAMVSIPELLRLLDARSLD